VFPIDEDLPRTLAADPVAAGFDAHDVRDVGLSGTPDSVIEAHARRNGWTLITAGVEFGNLLRDPPGTHAGIVLIGIPNDVSVL
jgi:predicted nuclease of predicted toxin-antitoxin system